MMAPIPPPMRPPIMRGHPAMAGGRPGYPVRFGGPQDMYRDVINSDSRKLFFLVFNFVSIT